MKYFELEPFELRQNAAEITAAVHGQSAQAGQDPSRAGKEHESGVEASDR